MKYIFTFFVLVGFLKSYSQNEISYSGVVQIDNINKDQLFTRARQWLNESFKSSKDVLQISDKETGELAGKGFMTVPATFHYLGKHQYPANVHFAINIWVKDGKYKYELKHFEADLEHDQELGVLTDQPNSPIKVVHYSQKVTNEMWSSIKANSDIEAKSIIASLQEAMKKKAANDF